MTEAAAHYFQIVSPLSLVIWVGAESLAAWFCCLIFAPFMGAKKKALPLIWLAFFIIICTPQYVGDMNSIYTLALFLPLMLFACSGHIYRRLALAFTGYALAISLCLMLDSYGLKLGYELFHKDLDPLLHALRPFIFAAFYLLLRKRLPKDELDIQPQIWRILMGLSMVPFLSILAVAALSAFQKSYELGIVYYQALLVLPITAVGSILLLTAISVLADHSRLQKEQNLRSLQEQYYQDMQREHEQLRSLRHDMRIHFSTLDLLLEQGSTAGAREYLSQLLSSPAMNGTKRICLHDAANAVLSAKLAQIEGLGIRSDVQVSLPQSLPIWDVDLCSLLGNALDNAIEAAQQAEDKWLSLRCRAERGLLMLRVEAPLTGHEQPSLATSKADSAAHGRGLPCMRDIARRYGGSLEAGPVEGHFRLLVSLPLSYPGGSSQSSPKR